MLMPDCDADGSFRPGPQPKWKRDGRVIYQCTTSFGGHYKGLVDYGEEGLTCNEKMAEVVKRIMRQRRESQRI